MKNLEDHPYYRYVTNPHWIGLSKAYGQKLNEELKLSIASLEEHKKSNEPVCSSSRAQSEFLLAIERIPPILKLKHKEVIWKAYQGYWNSLVNQKAILDANNGGEDFFQGERYIEPDSYKDAKQKCLEAANKFREKLERYFDPSEVVRLAKKLDLPINLAWSLFLYLITGSKKSDAMPPLFIANTKKGYPKFLFTATATRDELDKFIKGLKDKKYTFPVNKNGKAIKPYLYRYIDGAYYVAVDVYKNQLSKIRKLMPQINKLQSKLSGYRWRFKRSKNKLSRDLQTRKMREQGKSFLDISTEIPKDSSSNNDFYSTATLRKAHQRLKSKM